MNTRPTLLCRRLRRLAQVAILPVFLLQGPHLSPALAADEGSTLIGYIQPNIPEFKLPPCEGERYEAIVPDTLDLAERARLSVHALTSTTNPAADCEPYWIVYFNTSPPYMMHNCWQHGLPKFMLALALVREASGSSENLDVEQRWAEVLQKMQAPDGLLYLPVKGRPWAFSWWPQESNVALPSDCQQMNSPFCDGLALTTLAEYVQRDPNPLWKSTMQRLIDGMVNLATIEGDEAYFWPSIFCASQKRPANGMKPLTWGECEHTVVPYGLVEAYKASGYKPALALAKKIINYLRKNFYAPDGAFLSTPGVAATAHFHAHARGLLAMEEYAEAAHDAEMMQFVIRSYQWARDLRGSIDRQKTYGASLVGFFPEFANSPLHLTSETCEVADMVAMALRLSEAGAGDYWDDADRWIRNQLAENQLTSIDWVPSLSKAGGPPPTGADVTAEHVAERCVGVFAGIPSPNDWYAQARLGTHACGQCCTANGAKTLAWTHERIVRYKDGKLRVNLLLNRASPWADVDSFVPYEGRVEVKVKQPVELSIRIPEWVKPEEAKCKVAGVDRPITWDGRYAIVGKVQPNDVVTLGFPIFERTDKVRIEQEEFTLIRKGNDVVHIDPPGKYCPLYQREKYRSDKVQFKKVERFVAGRSIE